MSTRHLGVVCAVSGDVPPEREEWYRFLELIRESDEEEVRVLFRCGHGAPDVRQAREFFGLTAQKAVRFALMTDSPIAREAMAMFEWMGDVAIRAFGVDDFDTALEYLDVDDSFLPGVERKLLTMTEQSNSQIVSAQRSGVRADEEEDESGIRGEDSLFPYRNGEG